jgi:hypothetical protein
MQIGMFSITLSHFEHEFLCMMGALTFLKNVILYLVFFFGGKLWIGDKVIWGCMYNLGVVEKKQCHKKKNVNPFTTKLRLIMSPSF